MRQAARQLLAGGLAGAGLLLLTLSVAAPVAVATAARGPVTAALPVQPAPARTHKPTTRPRTRRAAKIPSPAGLAHATAGMPRPTAGCPPRWACAGSPARPGPSRPWTSPGRGT
jgi:hypothetical protein